VTGARKRVTGARKRVTGARKIVTGAKKRAELYTSGISQADD